MNQPIYILQNLCMVRYFWVYVLYVLYVQSGS